MAAMPKSRGDVMRLAASIVGLSFLVGCSPSMGSIGAMLGKNHDTGRVTVREVPPDMEGARAGLRPGDQVLMIDGRDARHLSAEDIHDALVGPIGSKVALTIERDGQIVRLEVRRGPLKN